MTTTTKLTMNKQWTWNQWKKEYKKQTWNSFQKDIMARFESSTDNIMVKARAGTGKTTLIYGLVATAPSSKKGVTDEGVGMVFQMEKPKREPYKITILAFNRHIADEIKESGKIPKRAKVNTAHGMAYGILCRKFAGELVVDDEKSILNHLTKKVVEQIGEQRSAYDRLQTELKLAQYREDEEQVSKIQDAIDAQSKPPQLQGKETEFRRYLAELVGFAQKCLVNDPEELEAVDEHYGITEKYEEDDEGNGLSEIAIEWAKDAVFEILDTIETIAREEKRVSFDSMLWLIWKWNLSVPKRDLLIVDEAQDANPAQVNLYQAFEKEGARIICVGDPKQAIQGFAGADHRAWEKLSESFDAVEMPLAQCFRCDRAILDLAQKVVPDIEPFHDGGEIAVVAKNKVVENLQAGDTLISRKNAPLMGFCLKTIQAGFSAKIRGRNVGSEIAQMAGKYTRYHEGQTIFDMSQCESKERKRIVALKSEMKDTQAENVQDKLECIKFCWQEWGDMEIRAFKRSILSLFDDEGKPQITYATIHRSKGDEAERIWILGSNWLPFHHKNMKNWQQEQEKNLLYVALTRAKHSLFFVPISKKQAEETIALNHPYGGIRFSDDDESKSEKQLTAKGASA